MIMAAPVPAGHAAGGGHRPRALPKARTVNPSDLPSNPSAPLPQLDGAVRLADWGLIRATGADAASFLHGQLTQDMTGLREGQARLAGYCSVKGRLLASFIVWREGPDNLLLACSADLLPATLKRLSMFVLRAKCKLSDASAELALWGLAGAATLGPTAALAPWQVQPAEGGWRLRLPDAAGLPRALQVQPTAAPAPAAATLASGDWQWLEVQSGIARIVGATVEQFVPQMVNLELVGGVNFQKGCYPGQELFHSDDPGQPAGLVALAAPAPQGGGSALVELKLAALAGGSLHLGAPDGPALRPAPLPYALPSEAA